MDIICNMLKFCFFPIILGNKVIAIGVASLRTWCWVDSTLEGWHSLKPKSTKDVLQPPNHGGISPFKKSFKQLAFNDDGMEWTMVKVFHKWFINLIFLDRWKLMKLFTQFTYIQEARLLKGMICQLKQWNFYESFFGWKN